MGRGPEMLLRRGAEARLSTLGHSLDLETVEAPEGFHTEITTTFRLYRRLAERVRAARLKGSFPLVLAGNCGSALGALAGLQPEAQGLIWFDAHGDFNTPETTSSGFLDGMGLAVITGRCWRKLASGLPGFSPLPDDHIVHIGGRDFDPEEASALNASGITCVPPAGLDVALDAALETLAERVSSLYVHIDLDVLDPQAAPANGFLPPGGVSVEAMIAALRQIRSRFKVCGAGLASYDPKYDPDGLACEAGLGLLATLVR